MWRSRSSAPLMIAFTALTLALSPACRQQKPGAIAQAKPAVGPAVASEGALTKPLPEEDCEEYADAVVEAVASGDPAAVNSLIDWDSIFATATADLGASEKVVSDWKRGLKTTVIDNAGYAGRLIQNSKEGGQFDYLRTRESHGKQVILFRMIGPGGQGVSYVEFEPTRGPDHKIRAKNLYPYISGELISETIRRGLLPLAATHSRTFLDKLLTNEQDYVRDLPKLTPITEAMKQGKKQDALRQLKELRPETKKQKVILLMRIQAAAEADETDYVAALEEFRKLFPNDPSLDLQSIDYYMLKKNFPKALRCVDRLDESVGGDPYLNCIRSSVAMERGDGAEARRFANLAIDREPSLQIAYFVLVGLSLQDQKYDETVAGLKRIHDTFETSFEDLTTLPEYAGFVKSPQYNQWLQYVELQAKSEGQAPKPDQKSAPGAEKPPPSTKTGAKSGG
jgi:hypothetical protein